MNFRRFLIRSNLNNVCIESIRTHFKFNSTQRVQQLNKLNKLMKNNPNLSKIIENKPIIVSKGSPNPLSIDEKGVDRRIITRRMKVLNKNFMQCITDVMSTEDIGKDFAELEVRITQVRVGAGCNTLNVYWISKCDHTERVAKTLDELKGKLYQHLVERNFMNAVPWIQFVLDTQESHCEEVERVLKRCDFGPDFTPFNETLFETPYEKIDRLDEKPNAKINDRFERSEKVYELLTLQKPDDMKMNVLGLDYELLINIVLSNLKKSRAQHRSFNAVADPLPPPDWSKPLDIPKNEDDAVYNTDERVKAMKRFLIENRKKKQRLSREARRRQILELWSSTEHLSEAKMRYEHSLIQTEIDSTEDYCDFDDVDNQDAEKSEV